MKTIKSSILGLLALAFICLNVSCAVEYGPPSGGGRGGYQQSGPAYGGGYQPDGPAYGGYQAVHGHQNQTANNHSGTVESYNVNKIKARLFQANISGVPRSVSREKATEVQSQVEEYADKVWNETKRAPSGEDLNAYASKEIGHPVRVELRITNIPGREVVQSERVGLSEVPASVRTKFEKHQ